MSMKNKFRSFFTLDDEYEYVEEEVEDEDVDYEQPKTRSGRKQDNVVSLKSAKSSSKMVLIEPSSYNEAQDIADQLVNRRAVVINLQRVDHHQAKRIVDFLSGTVYAIGGDIQKLGTQTFLCTPDNVEISGSISDIIPQETDEDYKRW